MPQNCIAPKPSLEGPPEMTEPDNSSVLAYPIRTNEQSLPKLIMYPITLKVINLPFTKLSIVYI